MPEPPGEQGIPGAQRQGFGGRMSGNAAMQEAPAHGAANAVARGGQFAAEFDERARRMNGDDQVAAARDALPVRAGNQAPGLLPQPPRRQRDVVADQTGVDARDAPVVQGGRQRARVRGMSQVEVGEDLRFPENEEEVRVRAFGAAINQLDGARRQRLQARGEPQAETGLEASMHASGRLGGMRPRRRQQPEREDDFFNEG